MQTFTKHGAVLTFNRQALQLILSNDGGNKLNNIVERIN